MDEMENRLDARMDNIENRLEELGQDLSYVKGLAEYSLEKNGLSYELAVRSFLPQWLNQVEGAKVDKSPFINRIFIAQGGENVTAFGALQNVLATNSGFKQMLSWLAGYADGFHDPRRLSIDTTSIEIDVFAYLSVPPTRKAKLPPPPKRVTDSPTRKGLSSPNSCKYLLVAGNEIVSYIRCLTRATTEATAQPICLLDDFRKVRGAASEPNFAAWLKRQPFSLNRRIRCLIFKLLQMERQLTFLSARYGPDCIARILFVDPSFVGKDQVDKLPSLIFMHWGKFLAELNKQYMRGNLTLYAGKGEVFGSP